MHRLGNIRKATTRRSQWIRAWQRSITARESHLLREGSSCHTFPQTKLPIPPSARQTPIAFLAFPKRSFAASTSNAPEISQSLVQDDNDVGSVEDDFSSSDFSDSENSSKSRRKALQVNKSFENDDEDSNSTTSTTTKDSKRDNIQSKKKRPNNRKKKNKRRLNAKKSNSSPDKVVYAELEKLFEEIAPVSVLHTIDAFLFKLEQAKTPKQRQRLVDSVLLKREDDDDEEGDEEDSSKRKKSNHNQQSKKQKKKKKRTPEQQAAYWMQVKIMNFLDLLPLHARPAQSIPSPAKQKERRLRDTASILRHARDKVFAASSHDTSDSGTNNNVMVWSRDRLGRSVKIRTKLHQAQNEKTLQRQAREMALVLAERLPTHRYETLMQFWAKYIDHDSSSSESSTTKTYVKNLFNRIDQKLGGHVHLVAPEFARFFYFDDDDTDGNSSFAYKEPRMVESKKEWDKFKEKFVDRMLALYRRLHKTLPKPKNEEAAYDASLSVSSDVVEEEAEDDDAEEEEEAEQIMEEFVATSLKENENTRQPHPKKKKRAAKKWQRVHLVFDTVAIDHQLHHGGDKEYPFHHDTTVFIDNLPIDITETEVTELFSRCGTLEHVEIFNQRPALDPGPLTATKRRMLAKQARKQRRGGRWTRPRTPVYGMLSFAEEEGARVASQDALRIFGMIVRGHSVRSIRAKDMTRLYIDHMNDDDDDDDDKKKRTGMDVEYSLSQLLNPGLYVSLDISSTNVHRGSQRAVPTSCEIMFPSFEVASEAFERLRSELDVVKESEECSINWMRTPPDAERYWTRELGGVM
ncbi:expressed unknown protein [Seminavis robusta]|uniref:RRM domain-containing protein n=1 Tax=Seminavis robusta TaxID=568900 RepID=A0A9N8DT69_9STRA|nr:expressed unknown protein [Seminavis robusta]|eukprot:Sro353_g124470.1 n/a (803) ;mRNA; r:28973-31381